MRFLSLVLLTATIAISTSEQAENLIPTLDPVPDPLCARGILGKNICCPTLCQKCGSRGCGAPKRSRKRFCCSRPIRKGGRSCNEVGPPCIIKVKRRKPKDGTDDLKSSAVPHVTVTPSVSVVYKPSTSATASHSATASMSASSVPSQTPSPSMSHSASPSVAVNSVADPSCSTGRKAGAACCPGACAECGGAGCFGRFPGGGVCCTGSISRSCLYNAPPCLIESAPTGASRDPGKWRLVQTEGKPVKRHEACFAWVNGKGYLIGGRGNRPVDVYNPVTKRWSARNGPPMMLHHMQCVGWDGKVWIVSAWTGNFPFEDNVKDVYVYDVEKDEWSTREGLPGDRLRGGAASVLKDGKIYVIGGNRGGHGSHAETLGWMDAYDLKNDVWEVGLDDLPSARDHVGGGIVGDEICVAGGRDSGQEKFFSATKTSTWCWGNDGWKNMGADLEVGRAGSGVGTTCDGRMMIVGGEGGNGLKRVDLFDGVQWIRSGDLVIGRHGTGVGVTDCGCGRVMIAAGAGTTGGRFELDSLEEWSADGGTEDCAAY